MMAGERDPRVQMAVGAWGMEGGKGRVTHRATEVLPPHSRTQRQTVHATKPVVMKGKLETGAGPRRQLPVFKPWRGLARARFQHHPGSLLTTMALGDVLTYFPQPCPGWQVLGRSLYNR